MNGSWDRATIVRVEAVRGGFRIRPATEDDTRDVRELDNACFPPDSLEKQRAEAGELELGVAFGDIRLLELTGEPVGYIHTDTTTNPGQIFVSGLAVHPRVQRQGLGTWMIEECLASLTPELRYCTPILTVTSPVNHGMLQVLFRHGFGARWLHRDHFGPGKDRFGLQLRRTPAWTTTPGQRSFLTPVVREVYQAVEELGLMVRGFIWRAGVPHYTLTSYDDRDFAPNARFP